MFGPVWRTPAYDAWMRQVITDSLETVRRSRELVEKTDLLLAAMGQRTKRAPSADQTATGSLVVE